MLNDEQVKAKWKEIKGGVRNMWGRITDDELEVAKGNLASIASIIQEKYGESKDSVKKKLDKVLDSFDNETDRNNLRESSYQRNPTAEPNVDADFSGDETNFSLDGPEGQSVWPSEREVDSDEIFEEGRQRKIISSKPRGDFSGESDDLDARH